MKIAIGSAQFGLDYGLTNKQGKLSFNEINKILKYAKEKGIKTIDTAFSYGDAEQVLGSIGVNDFDIISKLPPLNKLTDISIRKLDSLLDSSLNKLKINKLLGLLLHNPEDLLLNDGDKIYEFLSKAKSEDLVRNIGISVYSPNELKKILDRGYDFDIVQAPLNIFDRRFVNFEILDLLRKKNIELHIRSVFLQGLILQDSEKINEYFKPWLKNILAFEDWSDASGYTKLFSAVNYVNSIEAVSKIIIGVDTLQHFRQIIDSIDFRQKIDFPEFLRIDDERLINPMNWELIQ